MGDRSKRHKHRQDSTGNGSGSTGYLLFAIFLVYGAIGLYKVRDDLVSRYSRPVEQTPAVEQPVATPASGAAPTPQATPFAVAYANAQANANALGLVTPAEIEQYALLVELNSTPAPAPERSAAIQARLTELAQLGVSRGITVFNSATRSQGLPKQ